MDAGEQQRPGIAGGAAVVELTCEGIAPDPAGLAEVARRTKLHIIAGSGVDCGVAPPDSPLALRARSTLTLQPFRSTDFLKTRGS